MVRSSPAVILSLCAAGCVGPETSALDLADDTQTILVALVDPSATNPVATGVVYVLERESGDVVLARPEGFEQWLFEYPYAPEELGLPPNSTLAFITGEACAFRNLPSPFRTRGPDDEVEAPGWFLTARLEPMERSACVTQQPVLILTDDNDEPTACCTPSAAGCPSNEDPESPVPLDVTVEPPCVGDRCGEAAFVPGDCDAPPDARLGVCADDLTECPNEWPTNVPPGAVYVKLGGVPGAMGTKADPYGSIDEALGAGASTIAVAPGTYAAPSAFTRPTMLIGACASTTRIDGNVVVDGNDVELRDVAVDGRTTALDIRNATLTMDRVEVTTAADDAPVVTVSAGGVLIGERVRVPNVGRGIEVDGGSLTLRSSEVVANEHAVDCAGSGARLELERSYVHANIAHGVRITDGCEGFVRGSLLTTESAFPLVTRDERFEMRDVVVRVNAPCSTPTNVTAIVLNEVDVQPGENVPLQDIAVDRVYVEGPGSALRVAYRTGDIRDLEAHLRCPGRWVGAVGVGGILTIADAIIGGALSWQNGEVTLDDVEVTSERSVAVLMDDTSSTMNGVRVNALAADATGIALVDESPLMGADIFIEGAANAGFRFDTNAVIDPIEMARVSIVGARTGMLFRDGSISVDDLVMRGTGTGSTAAIQVLPDGPQGRRDMTLTDFTVSRYRSVLDDATGANITFVRARVDVPLDEALIRRNACEPAPVTIRDFEVLP